jgi:uncharacterized membrane protein YqjE
MSTHAAPGPGGLVDALRSVAATLAAIVRVRGALFGVELGEEIERRKRLVLLAALGVVFLHTALLLATIFVAVVFWDTYRIAAVATMTAVYLGCGAAALMRFRMEAEASPPPFAATRAELDRDLADLRPPL